MYKDSLIRLYKYRTLSGEFGRSSLHEALVNKRLYWQSPSQFNDPFDCIPVLFLGRNLAERRKFEARATRHIVSSSRGDRRGALKKLRKQPVKLLEERFRTDWPKWIENSSVSCFSEVGNHPLMWGHYADSHRGVCLIFKETITENYAWFGFPVKYASDRPRVNLAAFRDANVMEAALLQKSDVWAYEQEHRMIEWRQPPGYRDFPSNALVGIIPGCKISKADEEYVQSVNRQSSNLPIYRASIDPNEYHINIFDTNGSILDT